MIIVTVNTLNMANITFGFRSQGGYDRSGGSYRDSYDSYGMYWLFRITNFIR